MRKIFSFVSTVSIIIACGGANGGPGGGSAVCGINGANQCGGQQPFCSSTLGCVECKGDSDCPASDPRCVNGRCRACASNSDCGAQAPACWADHQCHASCTSSSFCQQQNKDLPICDTGSGACVGCESNSDCVGNQNGAICDSTAKRCVECESNGDCPASAPRCFLGDHSCVECLANSDCGNAQPICDPREFHCRAGCTGNSQCAAPTPFCSQTLSECVACLSNSDCGAATPICDPNEGRCVVCATDTDCSSKSSTTPYCDQQQNVPICVQCVKDNQCPQTAPNCNNGTCGP